jgi:hypothetical protein
MTDQTPTGAPPQLLDIPPEFKTVDAARSRLAEIQASEEWRGKVMSGDPRAVREFRAIHEKIVAGDDESLPGVAAPGQKALVDGQIPYADAVQAFADLRAMGLSDDVIAEVFNGSVNSDEVVSRTHAHYLARMSDKAWAGRLLAGGMAERKELALMSVILSGQVAEEG